MLDELQKQYFSSEEGFAIAMKLLQQYFKAEAQCHSFEALQANFLDALDDVTDRQSETLEKAIAYHCCRQIAQGGVPYQPKFPQMPIQAQQMDNAAIESMIEKAVRQSLPKSDDNLTTVSLQQAMDEFIADKRVNWKKNSGLENTYRNEVFSLFLEAVSVADTKSLTKNDSIFYKNAVLCLPANRRKMPAYRELSLEEILQLQVPDCDRLSRTTVKNYLDKLAAFLDWLGDCGYSARELSIPLKGVVKKTTQAHEERLPYSKIALCKLFNGAAYVEGKHEESFKYWIPLLLLLTGARANEICQLYVSDVFAEEGTGIWIIHINQNEPDKTRKSIKRPYHERPVPIHPILIRLGFIEYHEFMKNSGQERLFPELVYANDKTKFAGRAERWFNTTFTNQRNCDAQEDKTSLHSLRHNFINALAHDVAAHEHQYAFFVGQKAKGGVATERYVKPAELMAFNALVKKVTYAGAIDFSIIKPFSQQLFWRKIKQGSLKP